MVITVTLNPIVDYTAALPALSLHQLNRIAQVRRDPSGKGLNVSRMLAALGVPSKPFCLLGGDQGRYILDVLTREGLEPEVTWIRGETRLGLKIFETGTSRLTEVNEQGPEITSEELARLLAAVKAACKRGDWLVLSGSLPRGVPETVYADLTRFGREKGTRVVLDADREPFRLAAQERPYLVKPNAFEAAQFLGDTVQTEEEVQVAARRLREWAEVVFLTLGERGAALAAEDKYIRAFPPPVMPKSTVGCGDI
ncbi:MAG: 1-phosphofructokinase family hexose kinase, partial [Bacteroidota bacterium]